MATAETINISENLTETIYVNKEEYSQIFESGKESLDAWKNKFEEYTNEHQPQINWFFEKAATLYKAPKPEQMKIALVFNPNKGNVKGEPINNLEIFDPKLAEVTDAIYWVPTHEGHITSNSQLKKHVTGILHEGEHRFFQGTQGNLSNEGFDNFLNEVDTDPEVTTLRKQLFGENTGYLEATNELVTVYLESLFDIAPAETTIVTTALSFNVAEDQSFDILLAAMLYQDSNYPNSPTTEGPYANLRRGYRNLSALVLHNQTTQLPEKHVDESTGGVKSGEIKVSPYKFRGVLPTTLLEQYIAENKPIDKEFIVSLYKLAINYTEKE